MDFFIDQCPVLNVVENSSNILEFDKATATIITLNPLEEIMQNSLVNLSHDLTVQLSVEPLLLERLKEVLQVSINDNSGDTLENRLQVSSVAPSSENICEEPMSVSTIQDSWQDPSQQWLEVL